MSGSRHHNRPALEQLRYRVGTHAGFLSAMAARISAGNLPGLARLEPGIGPQAALLDAWASICDVLTFYQERIANEGFLRTATERRSIVELARLTGYRPRPGVAAGVYLAFTIDGDGIAHIPIGTRVQSVPAADEAARRFELTEALEARADWNQLRPRRTRPTEARPDIARFCASGTATGLRPGDPVLTMIGDAVTLRRIESVAAQFDLGRTLVTLAPIAADEAAPEPASREAPSLAGLADAADRLFTALASQQPANAWRLPRDPRLLFAPHADTALRLRAVSPAAQARLGSAIRHGGAAAAPGASATALQVIALPVRAAPFGGTAPRPMDLSDGRVTAWREWDISGADGRDSAAREQARTLYLDAAYPELRPGCWVAFDGPPGITVPPPRRVLAASIVARAAYGIAGRCTRLQLDGPWIDPAQEDFAKLRGLSVFAGATPLALADEDIGAALEATDHIELDGFHPGMSPGRWLLIEGELADLPGPMVGEVVMLAASDHAPGEVVHTTLILAAATARRYRRDSVRIWGNVARATEGESVSEILGSGDGARAGEVLALRKPPLTYVSAPTATGIASTLEILVNGVRWHEVADLTLASPADRVFVTETADDDTLSVRFGNGVQGARLPSGTENVHASYRSGIGKGGNCAAGQICLLLSRPLGVRAVTNPLPASGGADREDRDQARRNVPVGMVSLGRLVGVADYGDFARAFAGVGKAEAVHVFGADGPAVLVTVAGRDGAPIGADADLLRHLHAALAAEGDPTQVCIVRAARRLRAVIAARIGLSPAMTWEAVAPKLRAALLDRLGFERRHLGQPLRRSEVIAVMQAVPGVAYVLLDLLTALADPVTDASFARLRQGRVVADIMAHSGRIGVDPQTGRRRALPADLAYVSGDVADLLLLSEAAR